MSPTSKKITIGLVVMAAAIAVVWVRSQKQQSPAEAVTPTTKVVPFAPSNSAVEIDALKEQLASERSARHRAELESAALRNRPIPPPATAQITNASSSLRKVGEVGKQAASFFPAMAELTVLSSVEPSTLTPDEKRRLLQLQREHAKLLGALPEITTYQDNPEQYGQFFRSMFQEAAGLNDAQAAQVEDFMRRRGVTMNEQGLNAAKEPADSQLEEAWEERRDAFNEQTAQGLKSILPPGAAEKIGFGPEMMEFLEMDFDKITSQPRLN